MLKKMAWNVFRKTGSIDVFLEIKALEQMEAAKELTNMEDKEEKNGTNQDEGNGNCRK